MSDNDHPHNRTPYDPNYEKSLGYTDKDTKAFHGPSDSNNNSSYDSGGSGYNWGPPLGLILALAFFVWSIIDSGNHIANWGVMTSIFGYELSWAIVGMPIAGFVMGILLKAFLKIVLPTLILIGAIYALVIFA